ncbi:MAG TPA: PfkB family carbohydrate kinase [Terriglobales bacterium]|nr:PfkB family carbohydrate kinase [Terriglobales bacterium]
MTHTRYLQIDETSSYRRLIGIGGVGAGIFFKLAGDETLGRNESRLGTLLDVRDYCKLHIVIHYIAKLLGAGIGRPAFGVIPIAKVGDDPTGQRLIDEMHDAGMDTSYVQRVAGSPTLFSVCFQYPDGTGGNITTDNSAAALLSNADIDSIRDLLQGGGPHSIALAVPEVPLEVRQYFLEAATRSGAFRAASFAAAEVKPALKAGMFSLLDLVALNEEEGEAFVGCTFSPQSPEKFVRSCQELLRSSFSGLRVVVSAGKLGAYGITAQASAFSPAHPVEVMSTAGAGDSLLGGVLVGLALGMPFVSSEGKSSQMVDSALQLGVLLGSLKCLSPHTIHPGASLNALIEFAAQRGITFSVGLQRRFADLKPSQTADHVPRSLTSA